MTHDKKYRNVYYNGKKIFNNFLAKIICIVIILMININVDL
jgi:hypothetical protein